jgi:hypothetical protein
MKTAVNVAANDFNSGFIFAFDSIGCGFRAAETRRDLETVDFSRDGAIPASNTGGLRLSPSAPYNLVHSQGPHWSAVWAPQSRAELANRSEVALEAAIFSS